MIPSIAVFAERAESREDGKLDLLGVYNCRYVPEVPAQMEMTLALRFDVEPLDFGIPLAITVHVMDEDNTEMVSLRAAPMTFGSEHAPGLPLAYDMIVPISISFPREGT